MILLFYCFDYVVGPKETNWWAKWTMNVCCWEELWKGEAWAQRITLLCKPYSSHAKPKEAMSWLASRDFLLIDAVRWQFKSRVDPSRASKPWSSRVSFRFSQGIKDSGIFPKCYKRKNNISRAGHHTERIENRGLKRQRSSRGLEINSPNISLICLVLFSLIFHGFCPSHEWLVYF